MKIKLTVLGALFAAVSIATAQAQSNMENFFDNADSGQATSLYQLFSQANAPLRPVSPIAVAAVGETSPAATPKFSDLKLEIHNSWMQSITMLSVKAGGQVSVQIQHPGQLAQATDSAMEASELEKLQAVWGAAQLSAGDHFVGGASPDASTFRLTYRFCPQNMIETCVDGSVSGPMVPSSWGSQASTLAPLVNQLNVVLTRTLNQ